MHAAFEWAGRVWVAWLAWRGLGWLIGRWLDRSERTEAERWRRRPPPVGRRTPRSQI